MNHITGVPSRHNITHSPKGRKTSTHHKITYIYAVKQIGKGAATCDRQHYSDDTCAHRIVHKDRSHSVESLNVEIDSVEERDLEKVFTVSSQRHLVFNSYCYYYFIEYK